MGGQLCKKCTEARQNREEMETPKSVTGQFKMQSAKCGKKMKKKEEGGAIEAEKCGGKSKLRKKETGGTLLSAKIGTNTNRMVKLNPKKSWEGSIDGSGSEAERVWQDGTKSYRQKGVDTPKGKATYYTGRRGERGNTKGTAKERQVADSLERTDWRGREVPALTNKRRR